MKGFTVGDRKGERICMGSRSKVDLNSSRCGFSQLKHLKFSTFFWNSFSHLLSYL